jgi:hypothetical protein
LFDDFATHARPRDQRSRPVFLTGTLSRGPWGQ